MTEAFLQYVWQHQLLEGGLVTAEGEQVVVEQAGVLNRDAGPDFLNARVRIGGTCWAGNVEVHVKSSDWNLHKHSANPAYANVVLHVVYTNDEAIALGSGRTIPTVEVASHIPDALWNNYEALSNPPEPLNIPCQSHLAGLPRPRISSYLDRLVLERMENKCAVVRRLLEEGRGSWEQCCYQMMAHYFGGKANAFPFELLSKAAGLGLLSRWRDNPQRCEALLFGQAGLLEDYFDDDYPRSLQADYQALRKGANLTPMSSHLWKFFRLRPYAFPTIRISQFANLVSQSDNLFSRLLETPKAEDLQRLFGVKASPYWDNHFQFDRPSPGKPKRLGADFVDVLIINAWVPLLFEYGVRHGSEHYKDQAVDILQQLKPERNAILRQWAACGVSADNAADSQALIELYTRYCEPHDCLRCQIGHKIITQ